ncbi:DUF3310 domain-containing protein [Streptomyces sp. 4F14]|uniref:DUF3310 domain-containing protein n=1 Tax=Streptomyces sp. 4F14 TaxID=3394380 RepID=UPI003A8A6044
MKYERMEKVRIVVGRYEGCRGVVASVNASATAPYPYGVSFKDSYGLHTHKAFAEHELERDSASDPVSDNVNSPSHYKWLPNGIEVIDLTEHLNFNRGNAVKYLARAGRKTSTAELDDLRKAAWYIEREIKRVEKDKPK